MLNHGAWCLVANHFSFGLRKCYIYIMFDFDGLKVVLNECSLNSGLFLFCTLSLLRSFMVLVDVFLHES